MMNNGADVAIGVWSALMPVLVFAGIGIIRIALRV